MLPDEVAELPTAAIVTALPKEFAAVLAMFDEYQEFAQANDPNDYVIAVTSDSDGGKHYFPVALLKKMGNNSAAAAARDVLRTFKNVRDVLMVGIAGGIPHPSKPDKHVRLGDIVISAQKGVVQFDHIRLSDGKAVVRDTSPPPSARLIGLVNRIEANRLTGSRPWEDYAKLAVPKLRVSKPDSRFDKLFDTNDQKKRIKHPRRTGRFPGEPRLHYGVIGSSNTLLKDAKARDALRDEEGVVAVEMEGSGIADGAWVSGASYLLIRGVCDYADQKKEDRWQAYAAVVAASYARCVVDGLMRISPASTGPAKKKIFEQISHAESPRYLGHSEPIPLSLYVRDSNYSIEWKCDDEDSSLLKDALIIGGQGAGKSSICTLLFEKSLQDFYSEYSQSVPLFFDLEYVKLREVRLSIDSVSKHLPAHEGEAGESGIMLILDSLDQSSERQKVVEFIISSKARYRQMRFSVFSREVMEATKLSSILKVVEIEPLTDLQIRSITSNVGQGRISTSQIDVLVERGLIEALRTPFMATVFALANADERTGNDPYGESTMFRLIRTLDGLSAQEASGLHGENLRIEILLARSFLSRKSERIDFPGALKGESVSPFIYRAGSSVRFRHDIFRDYFVSTIVGREFGLISTMWQIYRRRMSENLSFIVHSMDEGKAERLRRLIWPIVKFSVRHSGILLHSQNPFLYAYIKILEDMKSGDYKTQLIEQFVETMVSEKHSFPFAYRMPAEITGPSYADFRLQNAHYLIGRLKSEKYRQYLFERSRENLDRYSVFGLLGYRDEKTARFLIDAMNTAARKRSSADGFFDITGIQYATSVITRFPFEIFPRLLYDHVTDDFSSAVGGILAGILTLLARRSPKDSADVRKLDFDDESYLRVTQSLEWLDFFFYCFAEGDGAMSSTALGCLKNHNWSGPLRGDIAARLKQLCLSERDSVRSRAIHACIYIPEADDVLEHALVSDDDMYTRLMALHAAWLSRRHLFRKYGVEILFANSSTGNITQSEFEELVGVLSNLYEASDHGKDGKVIVDLIMCTAISVNAPTGMMRGWGIELMAEIDPEIAVRIGEWIILNADDVSEDEHDGIFRSIRNVDVSVNAEVIVKGLNSESMNIIDMAVGCVDKENLSELVEGKLREVRERIPRGWDFLKGVIDEKVKRAGSDGDSSAEMQNGLDVR